MKKINLLFTLTSLNVILVTLERFSFTTKILLQPYSFLRLHEVLQMSTLILFTVLLPFLLLQVVSNNFKLLQTKLGFYLAILFLVGVYFYATGNGLHEVSSFTFNQFCNVTHVTGELCGSLFFNDYYTGNIYYFIGAIFMNTALLLFEALNPQKKWDNKSSWILVANAIFYALTIFAYAGFDRVLVGMVYAIVMLVITVGLGWSHRADWRRYPLLTYTMIAYTLGTIGALIVRLT